MALYSTLASLSQTAASNAADGAVDAPSTIDQQLNLLASFAAQLRDGAGTNYQLGPRNLLINAGGWINQRGYVSTTATTVANQYTIDRWRVVTSGQNLAFTSAAPDVTMTAPAGGLEQVIEGANIIGGVYTLSWSGTATATVNGVAITSGGNTASLTANSNVTIRFSGGTVLRPQFELGTVATPFERRLIGLELHLCQRYCEVFPIGSLDFIGNNFQAGQNNTYTVPMKARKRSAPGFSGAWTQTNVSAVTTSVLETSNVTINAANTAAGQWRITNSTLAFIDAEL